VADGTLDWATAEVADGARDADFVVLAAPVLANEALLAPVARVAADSATLTDVGSTKRGIMRAAQALPAERRARVVGSHPMAGSERSGYAVARADLFDGALVVVTPTEATEPTVVKAVTQFWEAMGARVIALEAAAHDRAVAAISHLPHVAAWALVDAVARMDPAAFEIAARGFRDTTRIAASDPVVWREVLLANRDAVAESLAAFRAALDDLAALIARGEGVALEAMLARLKALREGVA